MENPFTISFGIKPYKYISRDVQMDMIVHDFNAAHSTSQVYVLLGINGSVKTSMLIDAAEHL